MERKKTSFVVILEMLVILLGILVSINSARQAYALSENCVFFIASIFIGLFFLAFLFFRRKKSLTFLWGMIFIFVYLLIAGIEVVGIEAYIKKAANLQILYFLFSKNGV